MTREDIICMARDVGFKASVGKTDKDDKYHPDVNAIGRDVPVEWLERFAALVLANNPPQSSMAWQEGFEVGRAERDKELQLLRELAAGQCTIRKVIDELGPMSLWSNSAFEKKLDEARAEERQRIRSSMKRAFRRMAGLIRADEREACAKVCEAQRNIEWVRANIPLITHDPANTMASKCAAAIRARGQA